MSISRTNAMMYCKDDISKIANYDIAVNDKTRVWNCHHKLGVNHTVKDLVMAGLYYKRPASELVFLHPEDHKALHKGWITLPQIAEKYKRPLQNGKPLQKGKKKKKKKQNKKKQQRVTKKINF